MKQKFKPGVAIAHSCLIVAVLCAGTSLRAQTPRPAPASQFSTTGSVGGVTYTVLGLNRNANGTLTESIQLQAAPGETVKPEAIGYTSWYATDEGPLSDYRLVDFVHKNRYEKLVDSVGNCMCTKLTDQQISDLSAGKPQVIKIKFAAPPADVKSLTVELPHADSIDDVPVTQTAPQAAAAGTATRLSTPGSVGGVTYTVLGLSRNANGTLTESIQLQATPGETVKPEAIGFTSWYANNENPLNEYRLVDFAHKKRYDKILDSVGNCMCTKLTDQQISDLSAGKPQVINIKFEAPPADVSNLTVELPHAEPVEDAPVT
jgi:hypothetical protein